MRLMPYFAFAMLLLLVSMPLRAAVPLALEATAGTGVLLSEAGDAPQNGTETATISLTFTNTGTTPLKLCAFAMAQFRLRLLVVGPDGRPVAGEPVQIRYKLRAPTAGDYPVLPPGARLPAVTIPFPGLLGSTRWAPRQPGTYRVRVLYACTPNRAELEANAALAAGAFQGAVTSNALTFRVVATGAAVNGLQLGLDAERGTPPNETDVRLTAYLRNVSDRAFAVSAWNLYRQGLQIAGAVDGAPPPKYGGAVRARTPAPAEWYAVLQPGAKAAFPLLGRFTPRLDQLRNPTGDFRVEDPSGFLRGWPVGAAAWATAELAMPADGLTRPEGVTAPWWSGVIASPPVELPLNLAPWRQARLQRDIEHMALRLFYAGEGDKPYYSLLLSTDPITRAVRLTAAQVHPLITHLAASGALRDALEGDYSMLDGYVMTIDSGTGEPAQWWLPLGMDLAMARRLESLRNILPLAARREMAPLLERLAGQRAVWEGEEVLRQPISLELPAGTVADAVRALAAALHTPNVVITVDDFTGTLPVPAMRFRDVPATEVFRCLGEAADISCTIRGNAVKLLVWVN